MPIIRDIPQTFRNYGPTTAAEYWQCRGGQILISLEQGDDEDRGIALKPGDGFDIPSGKTVFMRATNGRPAWVSREVVG